MAAWTAGTDEGATLGEYRSKDAMFEDLRNRLGIDGEFSCVSSQGAFYAYKITKYGYHATERSIPDVLHRTGRKIFRD